MKLVPFITLLILSGFLVETNHYGFDSVPYNDRDSTDTLSYYDCKPFLYKGLDSLVTRNPELEGRIRGIILVVDTLGVLNRHQVTLNVEGDMLNQEDYMFLFDYLNQKNYTKCVQMIYPRSELKKFKEYKLSLGYK
jgi:hypothetical protein